MSSDLKDDHSYDAEKQAHVGVPELNVEEVTHHRNGVHAADKNEDGTDGLHRNLKSRHTSMLAIGGAIGTGLVIGSGVGLTRAGPVGLLLAFMFVGTLCYAMIVALGEMAAFLPHQRGFPGHATRFVNAGFGGMTGLAYALKYLIGTPTQFSAAAVVINYWVPASKVNNGVWIAIFIAVTAAIQFAGVRYFGEFEFYVSTFKILVLTALIIMGIVLDLGGGPTHDRWGFRTWRDQPFSHYIFKNKLGVFLGFWYSMISAIYSYTGTEMVGIAMGETRNPRKNIPRAVSATFWRIVIFYCGTIFVVGLIVPANSPLLLSATKASSNANASPFVVALNVAGVKVLPSILNACILVFVFSAANSDVYINSRSWFMMAKDGNAPKIFLKTTRFGVPWVALCLSLSFTCLAFTAVSTSAFTIFKYFVNTMTLFSTIAWMSILYSHIRFMKACKAQGIKRSDLPYWNKLNPYMSWYGLIGTAIISFFKGFDSLTPHFEVKSFVTNYLAFPIAIASYIGYTIYLGSGWRPLPPSEVDLVTDVRAFEEDEEDDELTRQPGFMGWMKWLWDR